MLSSSEKFDLMQRRVWTCFYCGKRVSTVTGEVHHQNQKPNDDRPENLKVACRECHDRITARYR